MCEAAMVVCFTVENVDLGLDLLLQWFAELLLCICDAIFRK